MKVDSTANQPESPHGGSPKNHYLGSSQVTMKPRAILIADDLTGACDCGLAFAKIGHSVSIHLSTIASEESETLADVVAFSTETRNLRAEEVEDRLPQIADFGRFAVRMGVGRRALGQETR